MGRAFLGLGSNLGDKEIFLREAVATFDDLKAISGISVSYTHLTLPTILLV